jgi:TPR repeat protein
MNNDRIFLTDKLFNEGNYSEAFTLLKQLYSEGYQNSEIPIRLAWCYQTGNGVEQDINIAKLIYQKASDAGDALADFYLGTIFKNERNWKKSEYYFKKSADAGNVSSMYWLGALYASPNELGKNLELSYYYLSQASEKGHVFAKRDIALSLIRGTHGKRSAVKGLIHLIMSYISGTFLVIRNPDDHKLG